MNKKVVYIVIGSILSIFLSVFMVCFINWEWDVSKMDWGGRFVIVVNSMLSIVLTCMIVANIDSWKKKD